MLNRTQANARFPQALRASLLSDSAAQARHRRYTIPLAVIPNKVNLKSENVGEEKKQKSEWTIGKILVRILLYPFCGFIIFIAFEFFFPDENYKLGVAAIFIVGIYLVSDILIVIKSAIKKNQYFEE